MNPDLILEAPDKCGLIDMHGNPCNEPAIAVAAAKQPWPVCRQHLSRRRIMPLAELVALITGERPPR